MDLDLLQKNPKNPNKHPPEQIKLLAKIMKHQGWRSPVVVSNRSGFIIKGHGRLEAAKLNKWDKAPVDLQDYASEADEYADMVADNKIAELADTDMSMVLQDVLDLGPDFDFDLLGIPDFKLPEDFAPQCDEDEVPEHVEPRTKPGDKYALGNHVLMCGDSTLVHNIEALMDGEKADMVFTDPPYGIDYKNTKGAIMGDGSLDVFRDSIALLPSYSKEATHAYIFFGVQLAQESLALLNNIFKQFNILVMPITHQNKPGPEGYFNSNYELCYFTNLNGVKRHYSGVLEVSETTTNDARYKGDGFLQRYRALGDEIITEHNLKTVHPTQKKVSGIEFYIKISSKESESVLDLFGGSGSTLIACEKTNRKCFMMELDPHYCDVIVARWEKYTGKKAELINAGITLNG